MAYVDLYLIHGPQLGEVVETYRTMHELKKQGLIRLDFPFWSFNRKTLLDDKAKALKLISV